MNLKELKDKFESLYGAGEVRFFSAAGRVNLIGEHIDYCGGPVLPAALNLRCVVAARKRTDNIVRMAATTIDLTAELDINKLDSYRNLRWGSYQAGVAFVMKEAGFDIVGCDMLVDCTVPFGSGLSSSAEIEVATALCFSAFSAENGGKKAAKEELAVLSQMAENSYCGVNCGIMDQFASACGKKGNAILLNCATLEYEYAPMDFGDCELVVINSNKPHSLVDSKYNERRKECEIAFGLLKKRLPHITCLADVTSEELEKQANILSGKIYDRALHVVTECERVVRAVEAMKSGDIRLFGRLLNESHRSLRDNYEVTGKELDALTEAARSFDGCLGSRMTGGGFGGCTVSVVEKDKVKDFVRKVCADYKKETGYDAVCYETVISDGAFEITAV